MSNFRRSKFAFCFAWAAFALTIAFVPASLIPFAMAQDNELDRKRRRNSSKMAWMPLADHAPDSARRLFGQLIKDYPGSLEALRAQNALACARQGCLIEQREVIQADEAEHTTKYRRAFLIDVGDRVFFSESSATIGGRARSIIENQARWLKARPSLTVTVIGRADDGGNRGAALDLSRQRAEAVRDRLVAAGSTADG